jgi:phosphoserine aminotransferase
MARVYNFSAGPSCLPEEVLRQAASEILDYQGCGMSIMEMSHRSPTFQHIIDDAEATLRRLLGLDDGWDVLFLQGGATLEFAAVPLNLMRTRRAGYVVSGNFSKKAWQEGGKYGHAELLASSEDDHFSRIPEVGAIDQTLDYVHICQNNTIFGTMWHSLPACGSVPLVADVSSCFLSMPFDMSRYAVIYAGAQKNAGPAGTTVVCFRKDLVNDGPALSVCPTYLNWQLQATKDSMYNTPNCWGIYMSGQVFHWVEDLGGLKAMKERNEEKVKLLYDYLDQSRLFQPTAELPSRSIANVTFRTPNPSLDAVFVEGAKKRGICGVKGHRLVGGMRASCYNAVPKQAVEALVSYMSDFESAHQQQTRSL